MNALDELVAGFQDLVANALGDMKRLEGENARLTMELSIVRDLQREILTHMFMFAPETREPAAATTIAPPLIDAAPSRGRRPALKRPLKPRVCDRCPKEFTPKTEWRRLCPDCLDKVNERKSQLMRARVAPLVNQEPERA